MWGGVFRPTFPLAQIRARANKGLATLSKRWAKWETFTDSLDTIDNFGTRDPADGVVASDGDIGIISFNGTVQDYGAFYNPDPYDLTASSVYVTLATEPNSSTLARFGLIARDDYTAAFDTSLPFNAGLYFEINGDDPSLYTAKYPAGETSAAPAGNVLRISEAAGTVTFATSPDGIVYTTLATTTTPLWARGCYLYFELDATDVVSDFVEWNNVNITVGGLTTIVADAGPITITGTDYLLQATVAAAAGTTTVTGSTATPQTRATETAGTLPTTGATATPQTRVMATTGATLPVTGGTIANPQIRVTVDAGTLPVTGTTVTSSSTSGTTTVVADSGAVTINGASVTSQFRITPATTAGGITITGTTVAQRASSPVDAGVVALTGAAVTASGGEAIVPPAPPDLTGGVFRDTRRNPWARPYGDGQTRLPHRGQRR